MNYYILIQFVLFLFLCNSIHYVYSASSSSAFASSVKLVNRKYDNSIHSRKQKGPGGTDHDIDEDACKFK